MATTALVPAVVRPSSAVTEIALVAGGVALLAASAQVVIPLPFTPVPVTGQTFAALLVGGAFGASRGLASMMVYLLVGALGAPVFAQGEGGLGVFSMPTAGYLVGMLLAATLVGAVAERGWDRKVVPALGAMVLGSAVIYSVGVGWLALSLNVGLGKAVALGLTPFLIGDALKIALAAGLLPAAWKVLDKVRG